VAGKKLPRVAGGSKRRGVEKKKANFEPLHVRMKKGRERTGKKVQIRQGDEGKKGWTGKLVVEFDHSLRGQLKLHQKKKKKVTEHSVW